MTDFPNTAQQPGLPPLFPFAAIAGQPALRQALLLAAIDPQVGGVLVEGPRGTAKSTAARALAELMDGAPFVTLPLGASLEHLAGSLDLGQAMAGHALKFAPGLLARAHGGLLYVDEINLLPDALVDVLLDAAASGVNVVERDGISHRHAARFVLVGTMNPEEGQLRPQLLDRLGLCVRLANVQDPAERQAIVRARLQFDADPQAFRARHAQAQAALAAQLGAARQRLAAPGALPWSDEVLQAAGALCIAAQVDGLRADLVLLRAARAWAAWLGDAAVAPAHVQAVAELVLAHRRKPGAPQPPAQPPSQPSSQQPPPPSQARTPDGGATTTSGPGDGHSCEADWGAMPPEPVGMLRMPLPALLAGEAGAPFAKKA
ncbi:Magnesium-chelatase 38 kDa subunit [Delftia tsuruhatensis]|uniref:ATP-binding protein n=1 Tax=Delftia tsuruhatensis TaxID=180282 RepID=UPI001E7B2346|nr:ATP-binding protein [Delftia tsuruhatensis]CAB5689773.1 Magnesium-chelatase 38 kDa subunit [Delftia tsuruhatensis]CAC9677118.1 Magnesium-chelatase 38 kDa subunit [Delftia tsuruhatensis]